MCVSDPNQPSQHRHIIISMTLFLILDSPSHGNPQIKGRRCGEGRLTLIEGEKQVNGFSVERDKFNKQGRTKRTKVFSTLRKKTRKRQLHSPEKTGNVGVAKVLSRPPCLFGAVPKVGATMLSTLSATQGVRTGSRANPTARDPGLHRRLPGPGLEFLLTAHVPENSCTVPKRHGRKTHQPYRGFAPDLPSCSPLSHGVIKV